MNINLGSKIRSLVQHLKLDVKRELPKIERAVQDVFEKAAKKPAVDLGKPPPASLESDKQYITSLYKDLLHREPDPDGFASHLRGLQNGLKRDELKQIFVNSPEYRELQNQAPESPESPAPLDPESPATPTPSVPALGASSSTEEFHQYFNSLMNKVGPVATPEALGALEKDLAKVGVTLQRNSAGEIRGRLYLPSGNGDPYSRAVDIGDFGGPWKWIAR